MAALAVVSACVSITIEEPNREGSGLRQSDFSAPKGYTRFLSDAPHAYRRGLVSVGDPVRRGVSSERFELRDGDCGGSDCGAPRSRAEIQMDQTLSKAKVGQDVWYGWSFFNASVPSFTKQNSLRLVFGQWTLGGKQKPIFRLIQLGKGEGDFSKCPPTGCAGPSYGKGDVVVQLEDVARYQGWNAAQNNGYICRLFDMQAQTGKWVDLTVNTNFSTGADGYLRVWVNRRLVCNYRGPVVSALSANGEIKHRRGVFSSWHKRWRDTMKGEPRPTLVVYYDEFRTGASQAEVDPQFLSKAGVEAVD
nr:heparin lyase I family protein [Lentibacter algarum]